MKTFVNQKNPHITAANCKSLETGKITGCLRRDISSRGYDVSLTEEIAIRRRKSISKQYDPKRLLSLEET